MTTPSDARMRWPASSVSPCVYLGAAGKYDVYWYPNSGVTIARYGPGGLFLRVRRGTTSLTVNRVEDPEAREMIDLLIETFGGDDART